MGTKTHFKMMADYHLWAYQRLHQSLEPLSDDEYHRACGLFFKSVHGTLNHLLLGDRVWHGRPVHQPLYIDGSATLWHFASRHSSRVMVVPLARVVTPRRNATGSPEGLLCLLSWLRCASYEGNNHSLRSTPCHENRQNN